MVGQADLIIAVGTKLGAFDTANLLRDFQCKGQTIVLQPNGGGGMGYALQEKP